MNKDNSDSSIFLSETAVKVCELPAIFLHNEWNIRRGIDTESYFSKVNNVELYRGEKSGIEFFRPSNIAGDELFYQKLETDAWYYQENKWEFDVVSKLLAPEDKLLELGCGTGVFLDKIKDITRVSRGLELNDSAALKARARGLMVTNDSILKFAENNIGKYDVVVSFQVMEHIANPLSVLKAQVDCLKSGGKLIISVPNNDGFCGRSDDVNNFPPHHMVRWNRKALEYLAEEFPLVLVDVKYEPLRKEHLCMFYRSLFLTWEQAAKLSYFSKACRVLLSRLLMMLFNGLPTKLSGIAGHTILAVYRKV